MSPSPIAVRRDRRGVLCTLLTAFAGGAGSARTRACRRQDERRHRARCDEPIPGQYIVQLRDTDGDAAQAGAEAEALADAARGRVLHTYDALHGFAARLTEAEAPRSSTDPAVAAVEEDGVVHTTTTQTPTPSWGLDRIDQGLLPLDDSYTYDGDGTGVTVFMIDTGILPTHTDFGGRRDHRRRLRERRARTAIDCSGHGTHVAGTIGGTTYGVAKAVQIVAVRVLNCSGSGIDGAGDRGHQLGHDPPSRVRPRSPT